VGHERRHKNKLTVDRERVKHWISQGAHLSETANNLLVSRGVIEGDKVQTWKPKKKKGGETPAQAQALTGIKIEAQAEAKEDAGVEEPALAPTETSIEAPAAT
jgi:hypothetical protein